MPGKSDVGAPKGVAVIGSSVAALQSALTLAQMGVEVKVITSSAALDYVGATSDISGNSSLDQRFLWPLLLQAASHPLVTLYTNAELETIEGRRGDFKIQVVQHPRYIYEHLCTSCGRCQVECSARITSLSQGQKTAHSAIHAPLLRAKTVPSAYVIDKNGVAPCYVACPLGINVQGFVSLLANGKTDKAMALINEAAPLGRILGRVCTHPCEDNCSRTKVDSPVFIRALHRYAADNTLSDIEYSCKFLAGSREEKIAIVGSGPAGLTAAWELTRRGYSPTVFESHGVIGGMLATGIPRFRLPREIREREIEAIKNLGIDIRTGITVGRDVTFAYLKERGYRAFFLAIGAQRNNKLNIPGEELEGVVDCMSLLLTLNLKVDTKVDTFVGSNVVVIGGGNAATDAARVVSRSGAREVTILYRRTRAEMPAIPEEVEEAIREGVKIEYCTIPVEILGDGARVTGIRCQRTELSKRIMANGRHGLEAIPGTDFVIYADHVVVAIGESPNASQLNMEGMAIDSNTDVIKVDPITLETSIPGVFAGGDCVTGPNNVVEAMAAGLRAAESIDRYIQGRDLKVERSLEPPQAAEIDIETIKALPYERADMPVIQFRKRLTSFEETSTGLSAGAAQREAQRCLNCTLCSQCMECTKVCELGAVFHDDDVRHFDIGARAILKFPSSDFEGHTTVDNNSQEATTDGIHIVFPGSNSKLTDQLTKAMALAMEIAIELKPKKAEETQGQDFTELHTNLDRPSKVPEKTTVRMRRIGVFLCHCGSSINSVIDFRTVTKKLSHLPGVTAIQEIAQACTEPGAKQISDQVAELQLDRVVIAACRCCNSEQVCYSCTDRRMMCQQYLNQHIVSLHNTIVEFVNIREQCAWVHKDTPKSATRKAVQIISAGIERVRVAQPMTLQQKTITPAAFIIGGELVSVTAARALASLGYHVEFLARQGAKQGPHKHGKATLFKLEELRDGDITVKPWPDSLELQGSPGNYEVVLEYGSQIDHVPTGAVLVVVEELNTAPSPLLKMASGSGLLGRIIARTSNSGYATSVVEDFLRDITIKQTSGIFLVPPNGARLPREQVFQGLAVAARVSSYLAQASTSPRAMAVTIDNRLCRGCGNCTDICPYMEMREYADGAIYAYVDEALCLGCGACITSCPTGAISQPRQSDKQIISTLRSMLHRVKY